MTEHSIANIIQERIQLALSPNHLEVLNESTNHNVPAMSETHFKVTVVSNNFTGQNRVKRQQAIYGLLHDLINAPIHALALHTYTPDEWEQKQGSGAPDSPKCRGGSEK